MASYLRKRIPSLVDLAKKAKAALTRRVVGVYLIFTFLFAVIFETLLYLFVPADLAPLVIRLGSFVWGILAIALAGGLLALLATKEVRDWLGSLPKFVEASFVTRRVKRVVIIASIVTALLYPLYQVVASSTAPSRTNIQNTPYTGTIVVNDPLTSNNLGWSAFPSQPNGCVFTPVGYELRVDKKTTLQTCIANKTDFSDFALQVQMKLRAGDVGGILFRDIYVLNLTSGFPQGAVDIEALSPDGQPTYLISPCLPLQVGCFIKESVDTGQTVTITVVARGASIEVYIDKSEVASLTNEDSSAGKIGVLAAADGRQQDAQTDVVFSHLMIWTNIT